MKFSRGNTKAAKLSNEEVYAMRREYEEGATQAFLSRKYGLHINTVGRIVRGEARQSVPMADPNLDPDKTLEKLLEIQAKRGTEILDKAAAEAQAVMNAKVKPERELERLAESKAGQYGAGEE